MKNGAKILVFEGIEGSGKTSIYEELKKRFSISGNVRFIRSKHDELRDRGLLRPDIEPLIAEVKYLVCEALQTNSVFRILKGKKQYSVIVKDRGWLSTRIYGTFRINKTGIPKEFWLAQHNALRDWFNRKNEFHVDSVENLVQTVYLNTSPDVAYGRLQNECAKRSRPLAGDITLDSLNFAREMYEEAFREKWTWTGVSPVIRIDTDNKDLGDVYQACVKVVDDHL